MYNTYRKFNITIKKWGKKGNSKKGKTIFPSITGVAQILVIVAQIHTNGTLKIGIYVYYDQK